ncbi:uncharacterized protein LOC106152185 [Lingula anatina]|uniref:Uncharacterized protein LOC106152185 n=1 Tax=Lingula anatina TaxID=7574 RepID=A0A1S3H4T2_LINAN|nr:uncharacterized protein LOC106152185 [Lingula anatina]|eukprot:XP_013381140.1 uncharacterized protein LOC106152185 [Lingula anatina]
MNPQLLTVLTVMFGLWVVVNCQPGGIPHKFDHRTTVQPATSKPQRPAVTNVQPGKSGCYWMNKSYTPGEIIAAGNCSTRWCTLGSHVAVIDKVECLVPPLDHPPLENAGCWWQGQQFPLGALIKSGPCAQRWCNPRGVVVVQDFLECLVPSSTVTN